MLWFISLEIYSNSRPNRKVFLTRSRQCILTYYNISPWYPFCIIYLLCCPVITKSFSSYDDVIKWKLFSAYWPFVRGIHRSQVNSAHKGKWRGALMFSMISVWINSRVNNREAGDLRRHRLPYDVIVTIFKVFRLWQSRWRLELWRSLWQPKIESMRCICWLHSLPVSKPDRVVHSFYDAMLPCFANRCFDCTH